jgi:HlyD family secretion protein
VPTFSENISISANGSHALFFRAVANVTMDLTSVERISHGGAEDLRETQAKIAELQERANAAADELRRTDLRSPQAGSVYRLQVHTIGGVIVKGDTVMQVAPRAEPLIVEAKVAPQHIDQVAVGASVRVRIQAGNRRTTPDLEGKVTVVSPDLTRDSKRAQRR